MKKCYWLGHGNLQHEYGYEPSSKLEEEVGDDIFQLDESAVEFLATESSDWERELGCFLRNPKGFCESWLEVLMRITPIESDFLERAVPAMAKGFLYILGKEYRTKGWDSEYKAECIRQLQAIEKGEANEVV